MIRDFIFFARTRRQICAAGWNSIVLSYVVALALVAALVPSVGVAQSSKTNAKAARTGLVRIQDDYERSRNKLKESLNELAKKSQDQNVPDVASEVQTLVSNIGTDLPQTEPLPKQRQAGIPIDAVGQERELRVQLQFLKREHALNLYKLSRRALYDGSPTYAYRLVRECAWFDSDNQAARRLLGFEQSGTEWVTPFAAQMLRKRFVWHDQFGWLPQAHVEKYENGQRFFNGNWMPAAQEAEIRRDFRFAWQVRTEHFLVKTNHSLERGVEIARLLEDYYTVFYQTFAAFFNTPEQMQKLFQGTGRSSRGDAAQAPHEVHYFRTRDEYNQRLAGKIPEIAITNGLYYTSDRVAYFFDDPMRNNDATLYHEATHQLFYESSNAERPIADKANFWVIEGIACYMESFRNENGRISLGDARCERFVAARYRYLVDSFYVPLGQFSRFGMNEFRQVDQSTLARYYSQGAGLAQFFMDYEGGIYRDALVEHLSQLYSDNARRREAAQSLADLIGVSYDELDRQYGQFVRQTDELVQGAAATTN